MYKPPDTTLFVKSVEVKFKKDLKVKKTMCDGLTGKYGIYFTYDGETVHAYPNDKDLRST